MIYINIYIYIHIFSEFLHKNPQPQPQKGYAPGAMSLGRMLPARSEADDCRQDDDKLANGMGIFRTSKEKQTTPHIPNNMNILFVLKWKNHGRKESDNYIISYSSFWIIHKLASII